MRIETELLAICDCIVNSVIRRTAAWSGACRLRTLSCWSVSFRPGVVGTVRSRGRFRYGAAKGVKVRRTDFATQLIVIAQIQLLLLDPHPIAHGPCGQAYYSSWELKALCESSCSYRWTCPFWVDQPWIWHTSVHVRAHEKRCSLHCSQAENGNYVQKWNLNPKQGCSVTINTCVDYPLIYGYPQVCGWLAILLQYNCRNKFVIFDCACWFENWNGQSLILFI